MQQKNQPHQQEGARGWCQECGGIHAVPEGEARFHCQQLMRLLAGEQRIDFTTPRELANPQLSVAPLFGQERGKMFGVLIGQAGDGSQRILRAFSGQFNGIWEVEGWAPPLFPPLPFSTLYAEYEPAIKELSRLLETVEPHSRRWSELNHQRKQLSRQWMQKIHALYTLTNFRGQTRPLSAAFTGQGGLPTGLGDCCAPKLLQQAMRENLLPVGLAEFYWGRENASQARQHGQFYPACTSKCAPILGFMLCGLHESLLQM